MRDLEKYQADYAALPFEAVQAHYRKRKIVEELRKRGARRILEVGCGLDPIFTAYNEFDVLHIVEPSPAFHEAALEQCRNRPNVHLYSGTLEQTAAVLAGEHFDFILLAGLLHEVERPEDIVAAVRPLCREDTVVHVIVPNARSIHRVLALEMGLIDRLDKLSSTQAALQQHRTFDVQSLSTLMEGAGFAVLESGSFFIKPFTHAQMDELMRIGLVTRSMLDGFYALGGHLPGFGSEIFVNCKIRVIPS
jgi:2-polyprenyl-3-methyl-5-hydroxy-6-metoxy-1,4-benzoquinol methylase